MRHDPPVPAPPEVVRVRTRRVVCDGGEGPLGHPRVWLEIGAAGFVDCPYCDRRFELDEVDGTVSAPR
ncbi:MAG: zinc-finger domain-containing protein [Sphingomonadaceae bacterium]|uniref:zinc-finger domain-containing protein n=1 Tax=Thermaurantiacus sp. TaxID=2820283 RepID=UPI00298F04BD|nr:zinc-finger domain-containing protein [Thermaurantiacus sp.]MCS6987782.1 zinc-finger domain-containing protein [Sphingomonadaceae bacterium]MDW8414998.1 zinc-finger domain-containing protein [Thermaurantiacus sp.]